jgi:hypothetical protein
VLKVTDNQGRICPDLVLRCRFLIHNREHKHMDQQFNVIDPAARSRLRWTVEAQAAADAP